MVLSDYAQQIQDLLLQLDKRINYAALTEKQDLPETCQLAAQGLRNLLTQLPAYAVCLSWQTPFMAHFISLVHDPDDDDTCAEQLYEDLIIFFREKTLRLPPDQITAVEKDLLNGFELRQSSHDPECMVCQWYWNYIPMLVQYSFLSSTGIVRRSGTEYLGMITGKLADLPDDLFSS